MITIKNNTALFTRKHPLAQAQLSSVSAAGTRLCGRFPLVYLHDKFAHAAGHMLQNIEELRETKVANLAPPKTLHAVNVQRLEYEHVECLQQFMRQLEVEVPAQIGNALIRPSESEFGLVPVSAAIDFARELAVQTGDFFQRCLEILRHVVCPALVVSQKRFQPEIETGDFIRPGCKFRHFDDDREAEIQIAESIALDRDRLDLPVDLAVFDELEIMPTYPYTVAAEQFPTGLIAEREGRVLLDFLEARQPHLWSFPTLPGKGTLVGFVLALENILYRLAARYAPEAKLLRLF